VTHAGDRSGRKNVNIPDTVATPARTSSRAHKYLGEHVAKSQRPVHQRALGTIDAGAPACEGVGAVNQKGARQECTSNAHTAFSSRGPRRRGWKRGRGRVSGQSRPRPAGRDNECASASRVVGDSGTDTAAWKRWNRFEEGEG